MVLVVSSLWGLHREDTYILIVREYVTGFIMVLVLGVVLFVVSKFYKREINHQDIHIIVIEKVFQHYDVKNYHPVYHVFEGGPCVLNLSFTPL